MHAEQVCEGLVLCIDCVPKVQSLLPKDRGQHEFLIDEGQQVVFTMAAHLLDQPLWAWFVHGALSDPSIVVVICVPPQPVVMTRHMVLQRSVVLCFSRQTDK